MEPCWAKRWVLSFNLPAKEYKKSKSALMWSTVVKPKRWSVSKAVFGYAWHACVMRTHRYQRVLRYHLANCGRFFCYVLNADTHISFSRPPFDRQPAASVSVFCQNSSSLQSIIWLPIPTFRQWKWRAELDWNWWLGRISRHWTSPTHTPHPGGGATWPGNNSLLKKNIIGLLWHFTVAPLCLFALH